MRLYSIQSREVLEQIKSSGKFTCDISKSSYYEKHQLGYDWMTKRMAKDISPPPYTKFPVWAFLDPPEQLKKDEVLIVFEPPEGTYLFSDYGLWERRVFQFSGYIPSSKEDEEAFEKLAEEAIFSTIRNKEDFLKWERDEPELTQKVVDSWERIFDVTPDSGVKLQAILWEIQKEWIVDVKITMIPLEQVEQAYLHFCWAIKLSSYLGGNPPGNIVDFDNPQDILEPSDTFHLPGDQFDTIDDILFGAENAISLAVGACFIALDRAMQEAGIESDNKAQDSLSQLRLLVYMCRFWCKNKAVI